MSDLLFLDTSALVKLYISESGSEALVSAGDARRLIALDIAGVEMASATWRRCRAGDLTSEQALLLMERFVTDSSDVIEIVATSKAVIDTASRVVRDRALRAYDAMHLAAALEVATSGRVPTFVAADDSLLDAASREGLTTWNPARAPSPPP